MDIAALYEEIQTRFGLSLRLRLNEACPPPASQIAKFAEVSIFGERPIDLLLELQDRCTVREAAPDAYSSSAADLAVAS